MRSLSEEIKNRIFNRIVICTCILITTQILTLLFYGNLLLKQSERHSEEIEKELAPFIISQDIIENRYAIDIKLTEIERTDDVSVKWIKGVNNITKGFYYNALLKWKYIFPVTTSLDNRNFGYVIIRGSLINNTMLMTGIVIQFFIFFILLMLFRYVLLPISSSIPDEIIVKPIEELIDILKENKKLDSNELKAPLELIYLRDRVVDILASHKQHLRQSELLSISTQVAHDIRSPVVALDMIIKDIGNIDEDKRLIMRNAANRIKDIANNLLTQYRLGKSGNEVSMQVVLEPELIIENISRIISEKRTQYKGRKISFGYHFDEDVCGKFALLNLTDFSRVLSNIIDNAIEAGSNIINIDIRNIFDEKEYIDIEVKDNGKGIPMEILKRISEGQQVTGKANGHGLGLLHAKKAIEIDWHGRLLIESEQDKGSAMRILLPSTTTPGWFSSKINIIKNMKIIVLDDDESIHHVWQERLKAFTMDVDLVDFYEPDDFFQWMLKNKTENILYLIDFEYIGNELSGLDVIHRAGIAINARLVTSRYEEADVRKRSAELGVKIIPKSYAEFIPICSVEIAPDVDLILLDNDTMITAAWRLKALIANKKIAIFNCWNDLLRVVSFYNINTPFYIDYELQDGLKGEVCAQKLYELGYREIYLTTGHPPEYFSEMPWIKKVLGKETPF